MDNIVLISIKKDELEEIIRSAIQTELKKKQEKELISSKELIDWLGISLSALNAWKREGKIPFHRMGKRIFFKRSEVLQALKESNYSKLRDLQ